MAGVTSFIGRALFALLFLGSGVQKLQSLDFKSGGPVLDVLSPKLDEVFSQFQSQTGYSVPVQKDHHVYLLVAGLVLELGGALLFIFDWTLGALLLLAYTLAVTPVAHDFWNSKDESVRGIEIILFFKNIALVGALLFYLGGSRRRTAKDYKLD